MNLASDIHELPPILEINLVLTIVFFVFTLLLISLILYLRVHKNIANRRKEKLDLLLIDFINNYLFNEEFNKVKEMAVFKKRQLKTSLDKRVAISQILVFAENLKGESSAVIQEIFLGLGLYHFLISDLKKNAWFKKAKALFVFYQLNIKIPMSLVEPSINSSRNELRQQAFLYLLHSSTENPLGFLDKINTPLTLWEQIYIKNALKSYKGNTPDFSRWIDHKFPSVAIFCMKMIADYDQFEHIPLLLKLLNHENPEIRQQAILSLRDMEISETLEVLLEVLIDNFPNENIVLKQEILKTIGKIGLEKHLQAVAPFINKEDGILKVELQRLDRYFNPKSSKIENTNYTNNLQSDTINMSHGT
ncbi:HEAT repeat domain-containing protein [Arenibacter sp. 6A1]|uniref:HEAT repeat domain-containing protein n=1 Tax=Arenibacter sp. 6A1 TaxID=2720391 RepID=UPI001447366D|nr:HEAT repeat domain-containing protein [Arenibacter sp. 6A1]NKI26411.1 HEAT repeat domain-containing protein [Arenibacter sp. 6A1]